jgi:recombination protein RecT
VKQDAKTALAERAKGGTTGKTLAMYLEDPKVKASLQQAAANHLDPDRLARLALSLSRQPQLAECTPLSILGCVMQSAQLGLEPLLGRAYYVPYRNNKTGQREAQFQLGYQGLLDLARRSGEIKMIFAEVVYEADDFTYSLGLNPDLHHIPATGDRGKPIGVYAVAHYKDGGYNFAYLTREDVYRIKARSKAGDSGPWATDELMMWKKTAIKALRPYLPLSVVSQLVVEPTPGQIKSVDFDDATVDLDTGEIIEGEATEEVPASE